MSAENFLRCYSQAPFLLTEGGVGLRILHEFGLHADRAIGNASLIYDNRGRAALECIYRQYLQIAQDYSFPILLFTNTRRANFERVCSSPYQYKNVARDYAAFLRALARDYSCESYIGGMIGCRGDAYTGRGRLCAQAAERFHAWQAEQFMQAELDFIFAGIMPAVDEIIGLSKAITQSGYPYIISLMIRENGRLIDGHLIRDAIQQIDGALPAPPLCYMTNCVHPRVLKGALAQNGPETLARFRGIQANAAYLSPEALQYASGTQSTDPELFANEMLALHSRFPLKIFGGCCGTDDRHIAALARRLNAL